MSFTTACEKIRFFFLVYIYFRIFKIKIIELLRRADGQQIDNQASGSLSNYTRLKSRFQAVIK